MCTGAGTADATCLAEGSDQQTDTHTDHTTSVALGHILRVTYSDNNNSSCYRSRTVASPSLVVRCSLSHRQLPLMTRPHSVNIIVNLKIT